MALYGAGLRLSECSNLQIKDIDGDRGQFRIRQAKFKSAWKSLSKTNRDEQEYDPAALTNRQSVRIVVKRCFVRYPAPAVLLGEFLLKRNSLPCPDWYRKSLIEDDKAFWDALFGGDSDAWCAEYTESRIEFARLPALPPPPAQLLLPGVCLSYCD